ncbi:probable protein phosphatase 2C 27 [Ipomoea triloba]|uniref:probable protein phosphatase 2C 27 n=1 Tax=Ipomoea triloba TaxID=35885 RepID=UPI00125DE201|nr:probable protein phosphatase 2C 27 [Ipomoea triloba]
MTRSILSKTKWLIFTILILFKDFGVDIKEIECASEGKPSFLPVFRSGSCAEMGPKQYMEDEHIRIDNLAAYLRESASFSSPGAFCGYTTRYRKLVIANAGDCHAVLGKRGRAKDHKPDSKSERHRIEKLGDVIYNGYLNGQLSVARALGDWHMKAPKGSACPLSAEPELQEIILTDDDEFLIMGCDGLWDVMSSQCAVTMARKELMMHNDPERCSRELVREALKRNTCDNLTVIVVCFSLDPPSQIETPQTRVRQSASTERSNLLKGVLESNS